MIRAVVCGILALFPVGLAAQESQPPAPSEHLVSLGMPPVYDGAGSIMAGWHRPGDASDVAVNAGRR